MLKKLNGLTKFQLLKQIMRDVVDGKVDGDYVNSLPSDLSDVALAFRRLHNTVVDQFSVKSSVNASSHPIWDEENERYF